MLHLSNFNGGIFNGCGRPLGFRWLEVGGIETGLEGSQNKAGELAVGKVSDFYCRKGMKKHPLICMSFAVAFQGFLPVEAIFAATLGFRLRQCGNQLAILAQNYGMDQWIAVTLVRDSCCLLPVWIGQCPMAMNMLELPLLSSGKTEKWGSAVFKLINTVADLDSEILTATAANVFCIIWF